MEFLESSGLMLVGRIEGNPNPMETYAKNHRRHLSRWANSAY